MPNDLKLLRPTSCPSRPRRQLAACVILASALLAACATPAGDKPEDPAEVPEAGAAQPQSAAARMQRAIELAQPRKSNLGRARALLENVLADHSDDARAHHFYARALLDQVNERIRLSANIDRLNQQIEQNTRQLRDSQQQREQLQRKLDALAEIEGNLSPRSPALPLPAAKPQ